MNPSQDSILQADRAALVSRTGLVGVILIIACGALALTGFFDLQRFAEGMPALGRISPAGAIGSIRCWIRSPCPLQARLWR
jgi:hypothetical protein